MDEGIRLIFCDSERVYEIVAAWMETADVIASHYENEKMW